MVEIDLVISRPLQEAGVTQSEVIEAVKHAYNRRGPEDYFARVVAQNGVRYYFVFDDIKERVLACLPHEIQDKMRLDGMAYGIYEERGVGKTRKTLDGTPNNSC
jgi:hypothetical protein